MKLAWMLMIVLMPCSAAVAQTGAEVPVITLPTVSPPDAADPIDAAPPTDMTESPLIELAPFEPSAVAGSPEAEAGVEPPPAMPFQRAGEHQAAPDVGVKDWLLPLVPASAFLSKEVVVGASMPVPGQLRLTGETASALLVLTIPDGVTPPAELVLSLRSSVNVLPENSHLLVQINGVDAGSIELADIGPFAQHRLPALGLTTGRNAIRLVATQAHRIFCGPEASFAIWTEVVLDQSGVLVAPADMPLSVQGFLSAMQSEVARGGAIQILSDNALDRSLAANLVRRITDSLGAFPKVEMLPFYATNGERDARARIALIESATPQVSFRRGAGGAIVLQIEHLAGESPDLEDVLPAQPADWGVASLSPGRTTTLAELGKADIVGNTHYFRQDVEFLLPEDWLLLASQNATFTIHYGFSGNLATGSLLLVKINGQTIRLLPLDRNGGEIRPPLAIDFRANALNPGVNTLTFEMSVPGDPPDLPCTPRRSDMLVILGDSDLTVPPSPRMRRVDLSHSLARLGAEDIVVPAEAADPIRDEAALMAFGSLFRPLVTDGTGAQLSIVGLDAVGLVPTGDTGVTRRMLQDTVYPSYDLNIAPPTDATPSTTAYNLADAEGAERPVAVTVPESGGSVRSAVAAFFSTDGWIYRQIGGIRDLALPGRIALVDWLAGKSGLAMLVQLDPAAPDSVWLVAGPDIAMADVALAVDGFRRGGRGDVHGQVALLQPDGRWLTWSARPRPELLEPLTVWNLRTVLGNYASWSPLIFTALTLSLALVSLIPALLFVIVTRRSGSRT